MWVTEKLGSQSLYFGADATCERIDASDRPLFHTYDLWLPAKYSEEVDSRQARDKDSLHKTMLLLPF